MAENKLLRRIGGILQRPDFTDKVMAQEYGKAEPDTLGKVTSTVPDSSGATNARAPRPSGAKPAQSYRKALESDAYKKLPPEKQRKFRKQTLSDLAKYKDIA